MTPKTTAEFLASDPEEIPRETHGTPRRITGGSNPGSVAEIGSDRYATLAHHTEKHTENR